jgi:Flp pilus assembly pilin Flp
MDSTPRPAEDTPAHADRRASRRDERGQGMVEYAFILILIAIAVLVALQVLGHTTNNLYSNIANGLNT